jgi:hypothetical protein
MSRRLRIRFAAGAIAAALFVVSLGSTVSVSAAIDPVAFQKLGCNNGDLACYYARLYGGYPLRAPYCNASGCTVAAVGDPVYGVPYPYYTAPYFVGANANAYYVAAPSGVVYPTYVDPGTAVAVASTFQGGLITPLNHP